MHDLQIGSRFIGPGHPCFLIAEAGVNHNGSLDRARALADAARAAGADAVKFQTFRAAKLCTRAAAKAEYQVRNGAGGRSQFEMLRELELSRADFGRLARHCADAGIVFLSTPFDAESAALLADLGVPAFKVGSGDLTNHPLLAALAAHDRPLVLSTGMATLAEVKAAVRVVERSELALLHCVSNYPAAAADCNLRAMRTMAAALGRPVGYSDHTEGIEVALAAAALGAAILEKHFTLDRTLPGPDHRASLEPDELAALVRGVRRVESALGDGRKVPVASEAAVAAVARRRVVAARDLRAGDLLGEGATTLMRAESGMPASSLERLRGRRLRVDVSEGTGLVEEMLA